MRTPRGPLVARSRLVDLLGRALDAGRRLTVVSGPAGFGKRTLLSPWLSQRPQSRTPVRVAWLFISDGHNDLLRLSRDLLNPVMGLDLGTTDVRALGGRTEGWVAGLQLAARLAGTDDHFSRGAGAEYLGLAAWEAGNVPEAGATSRRSCRCVGGLRERLDACHDARMRNSLDAVVWPVYTDRLSLRPATSDDVDATWAYRRLEDVSRWLTVAPSTMEEYGALFEDPERRASALVMERDGQVIGDLMLRIEDAWAQGEVVEQGRAVQAELGWVLHPHHVGRGYATEAVRELIRLCFEDFGLRRVTASCFAANDTSWRLMERVAMRREQYTVADSLHRSGEWLDGTGYALLAEEWLANTSSPTS